MARIPENNLTIPTLKILAAQRGGWVATSDLIAYLEDQFHPRGIDAQTLEKRNDSYFSQKVRNMVSHRHSSASFIAKGFANYIKKDGVGGLQITPLGRALLRKDETSQEEALDVR